MSISVEDDLVTLVESLINCVAFTAVQNVRKASPRGLSMSRSQFRSPVKCNRFIQKKSVSVTRH